MTKMKKILIFSVIGGSLAGLLVKPVRKLMTKREKVNEVKEWARGKMAYLKGKYSIPKDPLGLKVKIRTMGIDKWNKEKLKSLVPEFRTIVKEILIEGKKRGFDKMFLYETFRPLDRQVDIYGDSRWNIGSWKTNVFMSERAGHSWGRAVDIIWYKSAIGGWWNFPTGMYSFLKEMSRKYGLHGPWDSDQCHIQLKTGVTSSMLSDIKAINSEFHSKIKELALV